MGTVFWAITSFKIVSIVFKTDGGCFFGVYFKVFSTLCFGYRYKNVTTFLALLRKHDK